MDVAPSHLTIISSELGSELARLLKAGSSVRAAAAALSIHYVDALRYAHDNGLPIRPRRLDPDRDSLIRSLLTGAYWPRMVENRFVAAGGKGQWGSQWQRGHSPE